MVGQAVDYAELDKQRCQLVRTPELWQFRLTKAGELSTFAKDRDIYISDARIVRDLWRVGLLRADAVVSPVPIRVPSVEFVGEDDGMELYCDMRPVQNRKEGYGGIISKQSPEECNVELYFHPFRLYVLYHVDRVFAPGVMSTQYLNFPEGLVTASEFHLEHLDTWTSGEQFASRFEYWNRVAELAIVLEPTAYGKVFYSLRWQFPDSEESMEAKLDQRREQAKILLSGFSREQIGTFRSELCHAAEFIDNNKMVHVLLRLMAPHQRLKLLNSLGAAMFFFEHG